MVSNFLSTVNAKDTVQKIFAVLYAEVVKNEINLDAKTTYQSIDHKNTGVINEEFEIAMINYIFYFIIFMAVIKNIIKIINTPINR